MCLWINWESKMRDLVAGLLVAISLCGLSADIATAEMVGIDIGGAVPAGSFTYEEASDRYTINSGGMTGVGGIADQFYFVYEEVFGTDITLTAHVEGIVGFIEEQAGLMIRDSLDAGSASAATLSTFALGADAIWRADEGEAAQVANDPAGTSPYWVKLVRSGDDFTFSMSPNGTDWSDLGTQTIPMSGSIFVGIAASAMVDFETIPATFVGYSLTGDYEGISQLTWDGADDGNWGDPRWLDEASAATTDIPDVGTITEINATTVTVAENRAASRLTLSGGRLAIDPERTLTVAGVLDVADGASVTMGANAILSAGGGSISSLTTGGNATLQTTADMTIGTFSDGGAPGTFTKSGPGRLTLDNTSETSVTAGPNTVFRVAQGTLESTGVRPLDQSTQLELAGGKFVFRAGFTPGTAPDGVDPIGHWAFDEVSGDRAINSANPGVNDGWLQSFPAGDSQWVDGIVGGAIHLDGLDQWVDAGNSTLDYPNLSDAYTVALWVKADSLINDSIWDSVFAGGGGSDGTFQIDIQSATDGYWQVRAATNVAIGPLTTDWVHLAVAFDGTTMQTYYNGQPAGSTSSTANTALPNFFIGRNRDGVRKLPATLDEVYVYQQPLSAEQISTLYGTSVSSGMAETDVLVTADSTLESGVPGEAVFHTLTLQEGSLKLAGSQATFRFDSTKIGDGNAPVGIDSDVSFDLGPIDGRGTEALITKAGSADLVMDQQNVGLDDATINVAEGRLIAVDPVDSFGSANLALGGGELVLSSKTGSDVTYANALAVNADSTLTAGTGGVGIAGPLTVTLGSDTASVALNAGTVTVRTADDYLLNIAGPLSGDGGLTVDQSTVTLPSGGTAGTVNVADGQLTIGADLTVTDFNAARGTVNTAAQQIVVSNKMVIGSTTLQVSEGGTFTARSNDLTNSAVESLLTLRGGRLEMTSHVSPANNPVAYWNFNDGPDSLVAGDATGNHNGDLVNMNTGASWVPGPSGAPGDYALQFDGIDDRVVVPHDPALWPDSFTLAVWFRIDSSDLGDWNGLIFGRAEAPGRGYNLYVQKNNGTVALWTGNNKTGGGFDNLAGPAPSVGEWVHFTGTFEATGDTPEGALSGTKKIYLHNAEGNLLAERQISHRYIPLEAEYPLFFGAGGNTGNGNFFFEGTMDDIFIFDRALDAEEIDDLLFYVPETGGGGYEMTDLLVTVDTTLAPNSDEVTAFRDLTVEPGIALAIEGPGISVNDLMSGQDSTVDGRIEIRGVLAPGSVPTTLNLRGELTMKEGSTFDATIGATASDLLVSRENVIIEDGTTLRLGINGKDLFTAGVYTLIDSNGEEGFIGEFETVEGLKDYVAVDGLKAIINDEFHYILELTVLHDLHPGDADLNTTTDVRDFNVWNTNKFTSGTDWGTGDFDGNGVTDVRDFNVWNTSKFTSASDPAPVAGGQVPEPGTLMLLVCGMLGWLAIRRRKR